MKKLSFLLLVFVAISASAQKNEAATIPGFPMDDESGYVTYTDVIQVPGVSDDSLYALAMKWIKDFYKMPSQVIKSQEPGKIEIYHGFHVTRTEKNQEMKSGLIHYYLTLQFKDGRFKYTITKINLEGTTYFGIEKWIDDPKYQEDEFVPGYLQQIDEFMMTLVGSIESEIRPKAVKEEDDW